MPSDDEVSRALPAAGTDLARDTIAAIATPAGRGGIGVVRLSGPAVPGIARTILGRLPEPRVATFAKFAGIDQGIALYFPAPHSYTGEPVLELQGHGGPVVLQALLGACLDAGARLAEAGEFTRRAFLEGKLDLAQAEAVADLIDAASQQAARSAMRSLQGEFSSAVEALRLGLVELRALTEAGLDFPEEETDAAHGAELSRRLAGLRVALDQLRSRSRQGALLREGLHIVLAGRPNVGKSSLLNRLLGEERAIVTPVPGTTRDTLREAIHIDGVPFVLIDTAGLRESDDAVERIGVERSRRALEDADLVLAVLDATSAEEPVGLPAHALRVYNKVDLVPGFRAPPGALAVSALTGEGLDALRAAILQAAGWSGAGESAFLARERHLRALDEAARQLHAASAQVARTELFAEELRLAQVALGTVTGREFTADDLLGEIFSRFCIGK